MKKEISDCTCGGTTEVVERDIAFIFKSKEIKIKNAKIDKCNECDEAYMHSSTLTEAKKSIDIEMIGKELSKLYDKIFEQFNLIIS